MKTTDAKLIHETDAGVQVRRCSRKAQTWPGWAVPLDSCGYWYGTAASHRNGGQDLDAVMVEI